MYRLVAFLFALVTAIAGLSAQSQLTIDTLLPIGRVVQIVNPRSIPEYLCYRKPWIYVSTRYDTGTMNRTVSSTWRFETTYDTVRVAERRPTRTMLDANGDGRRDFYDSLLVLGSDTGWVEDTATRYIVNQGLDRRVVDLDADGYDDLVEGRRVYWGDSAEPLRHYSRIVNPEGTYSNQVAPAAICVVNRLQGIPAIATFYDIDDRSDHGRRRWFSGWRLDPTDVAEHRDTIAVLNKLWSLVFFSETYEPEPPTLLRDGRWLSLGYDDWIAFDSTGTKNEYYAYNQDTLILSGSSLAGSTMLPLSHPPTLDSMLQLTISHGSVLSVRQWLSPEQIIPVETRALFLKPMTIKGTKIEWIMPWPDITGDSISELAVYRVPHAGDVNPNWHDYCVEIYDVANEPVSTMISRESQTDADVNCVNGRVIWRTAMGERSVLRLFDASGRLLAQEEVDSAVLNSAGVTVDAGYGRGVRLIELIDAAGRVRRTTMIVR